MTERLHFHFSLSCIGEGNGNPLQCSCLENPRDRGAWWAARVSQSWTRLKRLSSSNSISLWSCAVEKCHSKVRRPDFLLWSHPWLAVHHHRPLVCPQPLEEMLSEDPSTSDSLQLSFYSDPVSLVRILGRIWTVVTVLSFVI